MLSEIISLCKRRGFVYPSSEIYGGFASCYDFGPLGVEMKNEIKRDWQEKMVRTRQDMVGLDSGILMSPKIWQASGHLTAGFADELVECKKCNTRFRADFIEGDKCEKCKGDLTKPKMFNLMMKTFVGPVENENSLAYLRAETCQGIYVNFRNVLNSSRQKLPFGIAQIGKAFRNEITPKNYIFRMREFEQMEMQYFCHPDEADELFNYWLNKRLEWYYNLGIKPENLRVTEVPKEERSHYAVRQIDIEYKFPFGWKEIEGVHNRGDWDLSNHQKHSGADLSYFDEKTNTKYIPHVIETSVGVERSLFAFLVESYKENKKGTDTILKLDYALAPVKVAILPLLKKEGLISKSQEIYKRLSPLFNCEYDERGSIGKRYKRQDEIGTFYCVTIDFETLEDEMVTVRYRDTGKQERIKIDELKTKLLINR